MSSSEPNQTTGDQHKNVQSVIWASLLLVGLLFVASFAFVAAVMFLQPEQIDHIVEPLVRGRVVSRALALFLIVPSISALTLMDKISGEAAIAALSAIAGYVLAGAAAESALSP